MSSPVLGRRPEIPIRAGAPPSLLVAAQITVRPPKKPIQSFDFTQRISRWVAPSEFQIVVIENLILSASCLSLYK
jgi:hypothetical protein